MESEEFQPIDIDELVLEEKKIGSPKQPVSQSPFSILAVSC
jgi:hypothetical protein